MSSRGHKKRERTYQLWGWTLFVMSSFAYMYSSFMAGDMVALLGSVIFFLACLIFLIPFLPTRQADDQ